MLSRISVSDGTFIRLREQWQAECEAHGLSLEDYASPHIEHAERICGEDPQDAKYGIYALEAEGLFECLVHANLARLPGTNGKTLRLLWVLLAPRHDFGEATPEQFAALVTGLLMGALSAAEEMNADEIKLQLTGVGDHAYFRGVASGLSASLGIRLEVRGNWLHVTPA
jgi:hypothetical protein